MRINDGSAKEASLRVSHRQAKFAKVEKFAFRTSNFALVLDARVLRMAWSAHITQGRTQRLCHSHYENQVSTGFIEGLRDKIRVRQALVQALVRLPKV